MAYDLGFLGLNIVTSHRNISRYLFCNAVLKFLAYLLCGVGDIRPDARRVYQLGRSCEVGGHWTIPGGTPPSLTLSVSNALLTAVGT